MNFHFPTPTHNFPFASRTPLLHHHFHHFLVMILLHLLLFRIQPFHGAHTDTSFVHAAILRTFFEESFTSNSGTQKVKYSYQNINFDKKIFNRIS